MVRFAKQSRTPSIAVEQQSTLRALVHPLIPGSVVLACVCLRNLRGPAGWLLRFPPLRFVGKVSYGWYLFHVPLFGVVFRMHGVSGTSLALAAAVSLLAATVSYYAIERPILRLKKRYG